MSPNKAIRARVQRLLSDYLGADAADPADEPAVIRSGSAIVYVRLIAADPPLVRVFSPMLTGVPESPELLAELNVINSTACFARVFWRDGKVFAAAEHLAADLDDPELTNICDWVSDLADHHDNRLQDLFGGELATSEG